MFDYPIVSMLFIATIAFRGCAMMAVIKGRKITLRLVEVFDAEFILSLRSNQHKARFLHPIDSEIEKQREWIVDYKKRESLGKEYYFVIEECVPLGLVRLYDFLEDSFCWGSFITIENAPFYAAIESVCCVYEFAFYGLGFTQSHFDVRKENERVVAFHQKFGANIVAEDIQNYYFHFTRQEYEKTKQKYLKFMPLDVACFVRSLKIV